MASQPIYQLYAELTDYEPKIWRRFQVMNNISMAKLGYIIMTMFEMQASHLFCFDVPVAENFRKYIGEQTDDDAKRGVLDGLEERLKLEQKHIELIDEDDGFSEFEEDTLDATETKLKRILSRETETMMFSYDYGDGWEIQVVLEKIFEDPDLPGKELPRVLDGEGYGIVEDCGGPGGLEDIAKAFKKKKGAQYQEYCDWFGIENVDLDSFDLDDMNFRVKKVPRIYADIYEYRLAPTKQSLALLMREYKK